MRLCTDNHMQRSDSSSSACRATPTAAQLRPSCLCTDHAGPTAVALATFTHPAAEHRQVGHLQQQSTRAVQDRHPHLHLHLRSCFDNLACAIKQLMRTAASCSHTSARCKAFCACALPAGQQQQVGLVVQVMHSTAQRAGPPVQCARNVLKNKHCSVRARRDVALHSHAAPDPFYTSEAQSCLSSAHRLVSCCAQMAKAYCREVIRILRTLKAKRDMSVNEARLIVSIEDPRTREQRQLGIEVRPQQCVTSASWVCLPVNSLVD